jgi:hypothetical protein
MQTASSGARIAGKFVPDDLEHARDFTPEPAYSTTKLYNILFTKELRRRHHDQGLAVVAFHPGLVAPRFAAESRSRLRHVHRFSRPFLASPDKSAAQPAWPARGSPDTDWQPGAYYERYRPAKRNNPRPWLPNRPRSSGSPPKPCPPMRRPGRFPTPRPEVSPMSNIEFVQAYSTFIESTMLDEQAFLAGLPHYITDESVLAEPDSLFGRLVGIDGWNQWRTAAADLATRTGVQFATGGSRFFENGDTVLHYYEIDFSAREGYPDGWRTSIIERYDFAGGKIAELTTYYADTAAFLKYFS